jgi:hypothetical protein
MSKRLNAQEPKRSPFSAVIEAHRDSVEALDADPKPEPLLAPVKERTRGKSANAQFIKLTSYIRRDTHLAIKRAMLDENREISELVEELLAKWLQAQAKPQE